MMIDFALDRQRGEERGRVGRADDQHPVGLRARRGDLRDVLGRGELADHVADTLIGAQVGGTGQAAGQHDAVVLVKVDLIKERIAGHGDLQRAYDLTRGHNRDERGTHAAATHDIDHGQAFNSFKAIGGENGNAGHEGSFHRRHTISRLIPRRPPLATLDFPMIFLSND